MRFRFCPAYGIVFVLAVAALAVQQARWKDKSGNMQLWNYTSWQFNPGDSDLTIYLKGNPVEGEWKEQKIRLSAKEMNVLASKGGEGKYELAHADAAGNVVMVQKQPSSYKPPKDAPKPAAGQTPIEQTITTRTPKLKYYADRDLIETVAPTKIVGDDVAAERIWTIDGSDSSVQLYPAKEEKQGTAGFKRATINGPVHMVMKGMREVRRKQKDGSFKTARVPFTIDVHSKKAEIFGDDYKVVLSGDVKMKGSDEELAGDAEAAELTVIFDEQWQPKQITLKGEPGTTTINQQGGGR